MPTTKAVTTQTDFSAGEIDVENKRDNKNPVVLAGVRQAANYRILNSKGMQNRCGRRALYSQTGRVERVTMAPGVDYDISFGNTTLKIRDSTGTVVFNDSARPWTTATVKNVVWAVYDKSIYITFAGMVPRILTWDGAVTWTAANFAELVKSGGQKQTAFYRIAPKGITLDPSATTGAITIAFSSAYLVAGMVGTYIRYIGRQMLITGVTSPILGNATVIEPLPASQNIAFGSAVAAVFAFGDLIQGSISGARAIIIGLSGVDAHVQLLPAPITPLITAGLNAPSVASVTGFVVGDVVIGPGGALVATAVTGAQPPDPVSIWDEEVMNTFRGWPQSVFVDQNRLGFCNFPSVPSGIAWSEATVLNNFMVGANPTDPIFELAPNKSQVLYVVPGMDGSEFVFCDNRLYYIQILPANPLKPGSVVFNVISEDECGAVQPRRAGEFILYVSGGLSDVMAVKIFGAYTRAYRTEAITELSGHLFSGITALAIMTASDSFAERYCFAVNADGSVAVGRYNVNKSGELEGTVGWVPWTGNGTVSWVAAKGANVLFTANYAPNGIASVPVVELLDDTRYLDASQLYNTQPAGLPIPVGKGPLWWLAGGTVDLMDGPLGTRMMGTYVVDADGFLVPQNNGGEDFASANLVCGQPWTARLERFLPAVQDGQDVGQRMMQRRILRAEVYVANSSGFVMQRLYSGQSGPNLPVPGTVMKERRISTWNQGEDPTQPPTLREQSYLDRPTGRSHDPRWVIVKDTPGPLTVLEISTEITV